MNEQEGLSAKRDWSSGIISQKALIALFAVPCLCISVFCLATIAASGCPADDFFFHGLLHQQPRVPLPDRTAMKMPDGAQGSHGGWSGGLYAIDASLEEVLAFYKRVGASCKSAAETIYPLGGFRLDIQSSYWECSVPAQPWSRGSVDLFPQAGYINALKAIYNDPPPLLGDLTIDETIVGYELRQFYGQTHLPDTAWPDGGTILRTGVGWCDPF